METCEERVTVQIRAAHWSLNHPRVKQLIHYYPKNKKISIGSTDFDDKQ